MTGHGRVLFTDAEARNLRQYLTGGGFLHVDDNYGMDPYVRSEFKKFFRNWTGFGWGPIIPCTGLLFE